MSSVKANLDTEARLLRVVMLDVAHAATASAAGICADVFSIPENRRIWNAITAAASVDSCTDSFAVYRQLQGLSGEAAKLDSEHLCKITAIDEPTHIRLRRYISDVLALYRQRKLIAAIDAAAEAARQDAAGFGEVWETVEPHLHAAQEAGADTRHRSLADAAAQAAEWRLKPDLRPVTPTPWPGWDRAATPVRSGELIVIGARTGAGKTTFVGNIADDAAKQGRHVAMFSLEMGAEEVIDRLAVRRAGRDGEGGDNHANAVVASRIMEIGKMKTLRIYEAEDAPSIARIEATCRLLASAPAGLAAVVIDYLQLVQPPGESKREPREQQVAAMSRRFKLLARAIGCPVFLLAQLNRESEKEDRRPRLYDLRESGSIEQDADRVWFLYRKKPAADAMIQPEDASEIEVALYQAKCRNGPAGIEALLRFNRPTFNFKAE
jgi:replicative DNA helicase